MADDPSDPKKEEKKLLTGLNETQESLLSKAVHPHTHEGEEFALRFVKDFSEPAFGDKFRIIMTTDDEKYACDAMGILTEEFPDRLEAGVALNIAVTDHYQWATVAWAKFGKPELDKIDCQLLSAAISGAYNGEG